MLVTSLLLIVVTVSLCNGTKNILLASRLVVVSVSYNSGFTGACFIFVELLVRFSMALMIEFSVANQVFK